MYTKRTYQDYEKAGDKLAFILQAIEEYKNSYFFKRACEAERYFNGDTDILSAKRKMIMQKYEEQGTDGEPVITANEFEYENNKISNNFIKRFVMQSVQYLLNNGVQGDIDLKEMFGGNINFVLQKATEKALLHGETVLFLNNNKLELLSCASRGNASGMFFLLDENDSSLKLGIRFWRLNGEKPLYIEVYDENSINTYVKEKNTSKARFLTNKAYITRTSKSVLGSSVENIKPKVFPFVILKADDYGASILTDNVKTKIDLYDKIVSDFGDNMERLEGIYWAIKNFGGTVRQANCMLADIQKYKMAISQDDMSATPQAIEAPFTARKFALDMLERALYKDCMALNMEEITGSSLTNVAIHTAKANLDMKCNQIEYQLFNMFNSLGLIVGIDDMTKHIKNFQRMDIANKSEIVRDIYIMRNDITRRKALELNPYIDDDEIEEILQDSDSEDMGIDELSGISR